MGKNTLDKAENGRRESEGKAIVPLETMNISRGSQSDIQR